MLQGVLHNILSKKRGSFDKVLQNREFGVSLQNLDANSVEAT